MRFRAANHRLRFHVSWSAHCCIGLREPGRIGEVFHAEHFVLANVYVHKTEFNRTWETALSCLQLPQGESKGSQITFGKPERQLVASCSCSNYSL
jgi:hypothetical protein